MTESRLQVRFVLQPFRSLGKDEPCSVRPLQWWEGSVLRVLSRKKLYDSGTEDCSDTCYPEDLILARH